MAVSFRDLNSRPTSVTGKRSNQRGIEIIKIDLDLMAGVTRLELATSCVTGKRSNQLSYTPVRGKL